MEKLKELIRVVFLSFEFLYIFMALALCQYYPSIFESVGSKFHRYQEIWKYIPTIPTGLLFASLKYSWKILTPLDGTSNKQLYEWSDYWKLKLRVITSITYCAASAVLAIIIWFFGLQMQPLLLGFIFVITTGVPLIVLAHQVLAAFVTRELMERWG